MNLPIAVALTASLAVPSAVSPAAPPAVETGPRPTLTAQAAALAMEHHPSKAGAAATRAALAPPGGDSLKNGAIIGGAIAGAGMGIFVYTLCKALDDTQGGANCAGPALLWTAIAGAGGAAAGAGIDALFVGAPAARVRFRF